MVGRADLCAAVLCFGAFICFAKCCRADSKAAILWVADLWCDVGLQWIWLMMCAVFSVCSMFCKEQGITIIVSIVV